MEHAETLAQLAHLFDVVVAQVQNKEQRHNGWDGGTAGGRGVSAKGKPNFDRNIQCSCNNRITVVGVNAQASLKR